MPSSEDTETRLAAVRSDIEGHRRMAAQVRAEAQALAREAELADRRVQAILAERTEWQNRKESAASHIDTIQTRITEVSIERSDLENAPAVFAEKRSALITEIEYAENDRRMAADALATAETAMAETDRVAKLTLEALSSSREATARAEERMEGSRRRLEDIEREIRDMLEVEPQAVAGLAELEPGAELPPLHDIEEDLEKMRRDRERLGAVNLRAEEELREVETQHTGLVTERDDLVEAIKRLRQGIQSLNKEARERLLTSFEVVNNHFKRLFVELFGGGEAALHLIESDDPLEAGLEIIAKPPGKKPQTLSLLSGGEQALTAMALIFAVFLTNPSPICVLDEVDAPLDDHNVERYCNLLHEMTCSTDTRFVIITHNPITMARMNRLFGVTMAERGVSQLVSVSLSRGGGHSRPERGVILSRRHSGLRRRENPESTVGRRHDLTHPPRRTQSRARRQAAGLFPHRRRAAVAEDLDHLSRRRRLRHDQVRGRCARLCAGAHAGDLRCRRRKPECADRDRAGPRSRNIARRRRRPGHRELGRRGGLFVAAGFHAARCQRHAEPAGARTGARQLAPLGLPLSAAAMPPPTSPRSRKPISSSRATSSASSARAISASSQRRCGPKRATRWS